MQKEQRKEAYKKLMKQVEENNQAVKEGKQIPHTDLWENKKETLDTLFHRELWADEVDNEGGRNKDGE